MAQRKVLMTDDPKRDTQLANRQAAATLAAALITASGRPHSVGEAIELLYDFEWSFMPQPGSGRYDAWKKDRNTTEAHR
jgi:hypothetical protein